MITSRGDFDREMQTIDQMVDRSARLPQQVFRRKACMFYIIDSDHLWSEEFYREVRALMARTGDEVLTLAVLKPDPNTYHYSCFGKFPLMHFTSRDEPGRYIESIHEDPGGSPADAIVHNSDVILIYPASAGWAIYADRDLGIAVVAVRDEGMAGAVSASSQTLRFFTPSEAVTALMAPVYGGVVPEEVKRSLVQNYAVDAPIIRDHSA